MDKKHRDQSHSKIFKNSPKALPQRRRKIQHLEELVKERNGELRDSEERLRLAQAAGGVGTYDWDLAGQEACCTEEYFRVMCRPWRPGGRLTVAEWQTWVHPDDRDQILAALQSGLDGEDQVSGEYRMVGEDGKIRWVFYKALISRDKNGRAMRMLGTAQNITDRKQAEDALHKAKCELEIRVKERTAELEREFQERVRSEQSLRLEEARLDALLHLSQISDAPLNEITGFTLEQAVALTHSKIGFLGFLDEDESVYTIHAVSKDGVKECNVVGNPLQWHVREAGIWADTISERKTLFVNDYSKPHPRKKGFPQGHPILDRFMVVPILDGQKVTAVAGVGNKVTDYDKSDERQVVLLLKGMWGYVQKGRSREELLKAHQELEEKVSQRTAELAASTAALRQSQKDLTRAQKVGQIGSWRLDVRRNVLAWSDENHHIFGVPKGTLLNYETFLGIVHPDDRPYVDAQWKAGLRGEPYDIEHRIIVEGQVKWVREKAYLERDDAGGLLGGFGITQDVTERKWMEEELRRSRDELELRVQERTRELTQTVQALHDKSEQLRRMTSELNLAEQRERQRLAQVLHDGLQQILVGAKYRLALIERSQEVQQGTRQIAELIDDAIDTSRSLTAELSPPILLQGDIISALEWLARWMHDNHGLDVSFIIRSKIQPLTGGLLLLLFQAVRELLFNVVKHAEVRTARVEIDQSEGQIVIEVADDGAGFDRNQLHLGGAISNGIGLFGISERLSYLGGSMSIDSAPGKGSRFKLIVPLSAIAAETDLLSAGISAHAAAIPPQLESTRSRGEKKISIVLVDDHMVMRQGLAGLLRSEPDFEVAGQASDGESAIKLIKEILPDVVLMDISMPGMDGIQATRIIHKELPEIRIIGLSMFQKGEQEAAMREAGAINYLVKSDPSEALIEAIRACVRVVG